MNITYSVVVENWVARTVTVLDVVCIRLVELVGSFIVWIIVGDIIGVAEIRALRNYKTHVRVLAQTRNAIVGAGRFWLIAKILVWVVVSKDCLEKEMMIDINVISARDY